MGLTKAGKGFLVSALSFAAAAGIQLVLDFATPIPLQILQQYRPGLLSTAAGSMLFVLTLLGFAALIWSFMVALRSNQRKQ